MDDITRTKALKLARKKFGERATLRYRARFHFTTKEREQMIALRAALVKPELRRLADWPDDATVGEYKRALEEYTAARAAWKRKDDRLCSLLVNRPFEVLVNEGWAMVVKGTGDSWREALAKAGIEVGE